MAAQEWTSQLEALPADAWPSFLAAHSGLPGPRANIALAESVSGLVALDRAERWAGDDDEYLAFCGAIALARRDASADDLRPLATDARWRVREGVAIGLQLRGDTSPAAVEAIVAAWATDPHPLVQRAAIAAICEPRLLRTPQSAARAIEACRVTTAQLRAAAPSVRRQPDWRTLRQALAYCWSVAVAADPAAGLPAFQVLDDHDPDVAWIVAQNRKKARLARLL